jgi:phosphate transport system protein
MEKHISSQFDADLTNVSSRVLELGGLVESQTRHAVYALAQFSVEVADQVIAAEKQVNRLEVEIDAELASIIARRQPTARDLRLLMAISKITGNLERAGDEAERIARMVKQILAQGSPRNLPSSELRVASDLASGLLRKALDASENFLRTRAFIGSLRKCEISAHPSALYHDASNTKGTPCLRANTRPSAY